MGTISAPSALRIGMVLIAVYTILSRVPGVARHLTNYFELFPRTRSIADLLTEQMIGEIALLVAAVLIIRFARKTALFLERLGTDHEALV